MYFLRSFTKTTLAAWTGAAAALGCAKTLDFGEGSAGAGTHLGAGGGVGTGGASGESTTTGGSAPGGSGGTSATPDDSPATGGSPRDGVGGSSSPSGTGGSSSGGTTGPECDSGQVMCSGQCIPESDMNCGSCGKVCPANANCVESQCVCDGGGQVACEDTCIDVLSNNDHCGRCDIACGPLGQCIEGSCSCVDGAGNCDGPCIDLSTSTEHCGDCATACGANQSCSGGSCVCAPGTEDCGAGCVDVMTDAANCGSCGTPCDEGLQCFEGACETYTCYPFEELSEPRVQEVETTDGACYRVELASSTGGSCWGFDGREMYINGELVDCSEGTAIGPQAAMPDGFIYIEVTAGTYTYAGFGLW